MGKKQRLDKILVHMGMGSRREVKALCWQGLVAVDGIKVKDYGIHVDPLVQTIQVGSEPVHYQEFTYVMLHKPQDVVSATEDNHHRTVVDLLDGPYKRMALFPVGRLDIDTEGLLLLTNDGQMAHQLLSPKKHVPKIYYAMVSGLVGQGDIESFKAGITLEDGYETLPAKLEILESAQTSRVELTLYEGKFHQVKRMFEALGKPVTYLKRQSMGSLVLDPALKPGAYRELTGQEIGDLMPKDKAE